jgi:hypothetical protein
MHEATSEAELMQKTSRPEGCPFQNCVYRVPPASIFVVQPHPADGSAGFVVVIIEVSLAH